MTADMDSSSYKMSLNSSYFNTLERQATFTRNFSHLGPVTSNSRKPLMFSNQYQRQSLANSHPSFPAIGNSLSYRTSIRPDNAQGAHLLPASVAKGEKISNTWRRPHITTNVDLSKSTTAQPSPKKSHNTVSRVNKTQFPSGPYSVGVLPSLPLKAPPQHPLSPDTVLRRHCFSLTALEQEEILSFSAVWFYGDKALKTEPVRGTAQNDGYDDDSGTYIKIKYDHIAYRYELLETLGEGSFGQVIKAIDHKTNTEVAIKIIRNKKRFHNQSKVEIKILNHLKQKDTESENGINIIHLLDYFTFRNHPCLVFELLGENLYEVIKRHGYRGFSLTVIQQMTHSLLTCLSTLRRENIIHCDLKPENILVKQRGSFEIKVIDFGSSCYSHEKVYTYIQSRFYRSPEIILGIPYTTQIDMWSLGCVLPELMTGKWIDFLIGRPIFPGENEMEQLNCFHEVFGLPPKSFVDESSRQKIFYDHHSEPRSSVNSRGKKRLPDTQTLQSAMRLNPDLKFMDLIERCLEWDPKRRLTPDQGLEHPWMQELQFSHTPMTDSMVVTTPSTTTSHRLRPKKSKIRHRGGAGHDTDSSTLSFNTISDKENLPPISNGYRKRTEALEESTNRNTVSSERLELPALYR